MTQGISSSEQSQFEATLRRLVARVEAWSYGDSDAGAGAAEEIAEELKRLASMSSTQAVKRDIREAQDALDDGLPAENVAAALYRVLAQVQG
jgi:hypothetical protein